MASIESLKKKYQSLDNRIQIQQENVVDSECLLVFDYEYNGTGIEISIDTQEFTALCPWTGQPDFGILSINYVPNKVCIELKSLKYYLMSYRNVSIVQEHAANKIMKDITRICLPKSMTIDLDYQIRGGLHNSVKVNYKKTRQIFRTLSKPE